MPTAQEMEFKWIREHMMEMSKNVSHNYIDSKIHFILNKPCKQERNKNPVKATGGKPVLQVRPTQIFRFGRMFIFF